METVKVNHTIELIEMLVGKHGLNREKTIQYVKENCEKSSSMKIFFSGFIFELSINSKLKATLK